MADILVTPPVRSPLMENDGNRTASRDWWLYFNQMTGRTNANGQMVSYGQPDARPDAASMPDGALYMETDPGYVIYQNIAGEWHYVAGTMWGTLSPDQRPTGLGPNDAGFTFRGTDQAREYIWSGTAWVETGDIVENSGSPLPVRGVLNFTGAGVTAADDTVNLRTNITIPGGGSGGGVVTSVFGRTGAVAAASGDYSASMVNNAVDQTGAYANPAWITSLAWSKITGTPAAAVTSVFGRTGAVVAASADYTAAQVTNAVSTIGTYADPAWITALAWSKITGAPAGYVLPVATTTVLGGVKQGSGVAIAADGTLAAAVSSVFGRTGAVVAASGDYTAAQVTNAVSTASSYSDPAWLTALAWSKITGAPAIPQAADLQLARSSASLTLTATQTAIPGATLTLARSGLYLITGNYIFNTLDAGIPMRGGLFANGVDQGENVIVTGASGAFIHGSSQWNYTATAGATVNLVASKDSGSGASVAQGGYCTITALWIHA